MTGASEIQEDFRRRAVRYAAGETVFLVDGHSAFAETFGDNAPNARAVAYECVDRLKPHVGAKVAFFLWGSDNGPELVNGAGNHLLKEGTEQEMLVPSLDLIEQELRYGLLGKPLHLVLVGHDKFWDRAEKVTEALQKLLHGRDDVTVDIIDTAPSHFDTALREVADAVIESDLRRGDGEALRYFRTPDLRALENALGAAVGTRMQLEVEQREHAAMEGAHGGVAVGVPKMKLRFRKDDNPG